MKKLTLFVMAFVALLFASCNKNKTDYKSFVGTWGVEKIEYFNIDYYGHPIDASIESFNYNPNDPDNTIQLVFREDKTGEMRDGAIDTLYLDYNEETQVYETVLYRPDTVLVYTFTYSYDKSESALYMNMKYTYPYVYSRTFMVKVSDVEDNSFVYENEYNVNYVEKAYLKRVSNSPSKSSSREAVKHPNHPGSFLGSR